jgi:serine phosphatase RsbU (regulator of sigma subunit)/HAMP domain-containing protein
VRVELKLRSKIILFITILVALIMITVTYLFTIREITARKEATQNHISRIAQNIATMKLLDRQGWEDYQDYISQLMTYNEDIVYIAIYDDRNSLRAHALNTELLEIETKFLTRSWQADIVQKLEMGAIASENKNDLQRERVDIQIGERILGSVHIGFSVIEINLALENRIRLNILLGVIFIFLFSGISIYISGRLTRPLETLNKAMSEVNSGNLNQFLQPRSRDEIAQLTIAFNDMVEGLRERAIIEDLARDLAATFQLEKLVAMISQRLLQALGAEQIRLYVKRQPDANVFVTLSIDEKEAKNHFIIEEDERRWMAKKEKGFLLNSAPEKIKQALTMRLPVEACLIIPMRVKDDLFGFVVFCMRKQHEVVSDKQMNFASILSSQIAMALENALLYETLTEQERMKRELEIARDMQRKLLPQKMPEIKGFDVVGFCKPATEVGGDYYDFFILDKQSIAIVIADVSGKGTSASFYMAQIKGMMLQLTAEPHTPKQLLMNLNKRLSPSMDKNAFVTMVYGILDTKSKRFRYARAGHNPLLKISQDNKIELLEPSGIGLGLDSSPIFDRHIRETVIELAANEILVFYTDGITEAKNSKKEEYGEDRLIKVILNNRNASSERLRQACLDDLYSFLGDEQPQDDMTMIILKVNQ